MAPQSDHGTERSTGGSPKVALRIILHPITLPYNTALAYCEINSLKLRRNNFQKKFFKQICHPENCLHDLLPPKRVSLWLRHPTIYPIPRLEQIGIAHSLTMHYRSISDECSVLMFKKCLFYSIYCDIPLFHVCKYFVHSLYILILVVF